MTSLFVELLPMILAAILSPLWIIIVLLMLPSSHGLAKAALFVLGLTLVRLIQGLLFGYVFGSSPDAAAENGGSSPVVSTLLLILGILLLVACYRKWTKAEDPDDPPPQWMQTIEQLSPLRALGVGAGLMSIGVKQWVFTLSAIGIIRERELGLAESSLAYVIFVVLVQIHLILPILIYAVAPQASATRLQQATGWLVQYSRPIGIAVSLIFGVYFTWKGISGLLA